MFTDRQMINGQTYVRLPNGQLEMVLKRDGHEVVPIPFYRAPSAEKNYKRYAHQALAAMLRGEFDLFESNSDLGINGTAYAYLDRAYGEQVRLKMLDDWAFRPQGFVLALQVGGSPSRYYVMPNSTLHLDAPGKPAKFFPTQEELSEYCRAATDDANSLFRQYWAPAPTEERNAFYESVIRGNDYSALVKTLFEIQMTDRHWQFIIYEAARKVK